MQSFSDDSLTVCPECEGRLRKVFANVGVVFKGSGFYRNDSADRRQGRSGGLRPGREVVGTSRATRAPATSRGDKGSGDKSSGGSGAKSGDKASAGSGSSGSGSSGSGSSGSGPAVRASGSGSGSAA